MKLITLVILCEEDALIEWYKELPPGVRNIWESQVSLDYVKEKGVGKSLQMTSTVFSERIEDTIDGLI